MSMPTPLAIISALREEGSSLETAALEITQHVVKS